MISDELRSEAADIPWKQWYGVIDIFAHQYSNLDHGSAWDTKTKELPALVQHINDVFYQGRMIDSGEIIGECLKDGSVTYEI